jgi:heat shock protein HslJ
VYYYSQYQDWQQRGVAGDGSSKETPQTTTIYYLKVIHTNNSVDVREITITVEPAPEKPKITQFSVDPPDQITQGQSVIIRWQVDGNVTSVTLTVNGAELSRASKGEISHTPPSTGEWFYELKAVGPGGNNGDSEKVTVVPEEVPVPPPEDPVIYAFDVSPNQITVDNCVNIAWSAGGGTASVRIMRDGATYYDPPDLQGSFCDVLNEARQYTYQLLARGQAKDVPSDVKKVNVSAAPPPNPLANTSWVVTSIQDASLTVPDRPPTAYFSADGGITGAGACMTYGGSYGAEGNSIWISAQSAALQCDCPDIEACTAQDQAFLDKLPMATNFSVDGGQLLLLDPGGMRLMMLSPR